MDNAEDGGDAGAGPSGDLLDEAEERELEALRAEVEERYDFDEFGPADMAEMSGEEWEAVFDADTWVTGRDLLDRVEKDLKSRIARRDVFAEVDRVSEDGQPLLAAWSDEGYAVVYPDGAVEGAGTVLRDVTASVALCSMDSYDPEEPPAAYELPTPEDVESGTGEFGNLMLQVVAGVQLLAGVVLLAASVATDLDTIVAPAMGLAFLLVGVFLFAMVANARLSDRFRSEEYRDRLRALRAAEERPGFVPVDGEVIDDGGDDG